MIKPLLFLLLLAIPLSSQAELPASVQKDMLMLSLSDNLKTKNWQQSLDDISALEQLGISLPSPFYYFKGEASYKTQKYASTITALTKYIELEGDSGRYYKSSIRMLYDAQKKNTAEQHASFKSEEASLIALYSRIGLTIDDEMSSLEIKMSNLCRKRVWGRYLTSLKMNKVNPENGWNVNGDKKHLKWLMSENYKERKKLEKESSRIQSSLTGAIEATISMLQQAEQYTSKYNIPNNFSFDDIPNANKLLRQAQLVGNCGWEETNDYKGPISVTQSEGVIVDLYYKQGGLTGSETLWRIQNKSRNTVSVSLLDLKYTCQNDDFWHVPSLMAGAGSLIKEILPGEVTIAGGDIFACSKHSLNQNGIKRAHATLKFN